MLAADDDAGVQVPPSGEPRLAGAAVAATIAPLPTVTGAPVAAAVPSAGSTAPATMPAAVAETEVIGSLAAAVPATAPPAAEEQTAEAQSEGSEAAAAGVSEGGGILGKLKAVGQKVSESERVQQGVEFVKKKTTELAESERVQRGLEYAKDTAKVVTEKTQRGLEVVSERTHQGLEFAKEKTRVVREGAGSVWEKGRGSIQRVKAEVGKMAWRGSARETLDMAAREEQWRGIKVQGAEELAVPARTEHTSAYHVAKGSTLRWTFRVKDYDIGFGVRMRVQEWGGSREEEVLAVERYDSADTISGSWVADENRTIVLSFDNRYSRLRSKTVAYLVGTEKPPVFAEPLPEDAAATSSSAPASAIPPSFPSPVV
mmetsp:Transcript_127134/g.354007  ORF Transcript_127134/g.354007 Transcript_127134/m.354007 type:complete len:372 (-) Transcript_127134:213-1328(-)